MHELPSISRTSKDVLQDGDVITVEQGVYTPNEFGVRIEDTLVVKGRVETLTSYTKELVVIG